MTTVGLAMIVKNEAAALPRLAASLRGQIDHWTVVDTGSTDGTQDIARRVFGAIAGELIEDEWRGYGPSRNVALSAAVQSSDWILTLDADDTFHGTIDRAALEEELDGLEAEYHYAQLRWWVPRLLRSTAGWQWRGRAHEYLFVPGRERRLARLGSFYVEHHADGGNRGNKAERELALLREDWDAGADLDRTSFYLARTLEDAGRHAEAVAWYRRRIDIGGWDEETWYARWCLGRCLLTGGEVDEACGLFWSAWAERPWRAEPLWSLAEHYRLAGRWEASWQACNAAIRCCGIEPFRSGDDAAVGGSDRLFVHADVWQWRMAYEISIAAWYVDERPIGRRALEHVLAQPGLPDHIRANIHANQAYYSEDAS